MMRQKLKTDMKKLIIIYRYFPTAAHSICLTKNSSISWTTFELILIQDVLVMFITIHGMDVNQVKPNYEVLCSLFD
jgi:hypothetical protein